MTEYEISYNDRRSKLTAQTKASALRKAAERSTTLQTTVTLYQKGRARPIARFTHDAGHRMQELSTKLLERAASHIKFVGVTDVSLSELFGSGDEVRMVWRINAPDLQFDVTVSVKKEPT